MPKIYQLSCPTYDVIISNKDIISNQAEINSFRFLTLPLILMWAWIFLREVISAQCLSTFGGINSELEHRYGERCLVSSMAVQKLPLGTLNDDRLLWKAVFQVWQILLKESPRLTFQMISRLSEYLIRCNPLIRQCLILTYSHIFLDEFQDTTTIQYDLIKTCFHDSDCTFTAVGDYKQRIMLWAGADRDVFDKFETDFRAIKLQLIMNYRCAPKLIQIQSILTKKISGEIVNISSCDKWREEDGLCQIWNFDDYKQESDIVAKKIACWIKNENMKPQDICILVKQRPDKYSTQLIKSLGDFGIKSRNESLLQDLVAEELCKILLDIMTLIFFPKAGKEWIEVVDLLKRVRFIDFQDNEKIKLIEQELSNFLTPYKQDFLRISSSEEVEDVLANILNWIGQEELKNLFPQYKNNNYYKHLIKSIADHLWNNFTGDWMKTLEFIKGKDVIPIMTIHKSKGLEYDTVIFVGLEDSAFWNFKKQNEEDTCAFFVALSRAKRRVIFTFSKIRNTGRYGVLCCQDHSTIGSLYDMLEKAGVKNVTDFQNVSGR